MRRREFIGIFAGGPVANSPTLLAQQPRRSRVIGFLGATTPTAHGSLLRPSLAALASLDENEVAS
jgi:hypothetical protein